MTSKSANKLDACNPRNCLRLLSHSSLVTFTLQLEPAAGGQLLACNTVCTLVVSVDSFPASHVTPSILTDAGVITSIAVASELPAGFVNASLAVASSSVIGLPDGADDVVGLPVGAGVGLPVGLPVSGSVVGLPVGDASGLVVPIRYLCTGSSLVQAVISLS